MHNTPTQISPHSINIELSKALTVTTTINHQQDILRVIINTIQMLLLHQISSMIAKVPSFLKRKEPNYKEQKLNWMITWRIWLIWRWYQEEKKAKSKNKNSRINLQCQITISSRRINHLTRIRSKICMIRLINHLMRSLQWEI